MLIGTSGSSTWDFSTISAKNIVFFFGTTLRADASTKVFLMAKGTKSLTHYLVKIKAVDILNVDLTEIEEIVSFLTSIIATFHS